MAGSKKDFCACVCVEKGGGQVISRIVILQSTTAFKDCFMRFLPSPQIEREYFNSTFVNKQRIHPNNLAAKHVFTAHQPNLF